MVANTNYQDDTLLCDNFPTSLTAKGELFKVPTGFEDITRHYHDLQLKFRGTGSEKVKLKGSSTSKLSSSSEQQTTWSVEGTFNSVSSHGSLTFENACGEKIEIEFIAYQDGRICVIPDEFTGAFVCISG